MYNIDQNGKYNMYAMMTLVKRIKNGEFLFYFPNKILLIHSYCDF